MQGQNGDLVGLFYLFAGEFIVASKLVDDYTCAIEDLEYNMILLKRLVDAGEFSIAIGHVKRVVEKSPPLLHELRCELFSWLSSSSKQEPILELIQVIDLNVSNKIM